MHEIRILILGDGKNNLEKVGKTSMVHSLLSDDRNAELPDVHPTIKIPAEMCQSDCSVTIVDTFYRRDLETEPLIQEELSKADAILLVYDISKPETIERLSAYWLDLISHSTKAPIVIVGNKADLKIESQYESLEDIMRPIAKDYKQCEAILECSAVSQFNLNEVYAYAQKIVLYPSSPLYNSITKELTQKYEKALKLIFRRCDKDKDFLLNDKEVIAMHAEIFHTQLGVEEVERIKEVIKQERPEGIEEKGINLKGFFQLQKMMIQRLKINVCWNMLRHFHYDDDLNLNIEFVLKKNPEQSTELSRAAITYLIRTFEQYATEGLLDLASFEDVFSTASDIPWDFERLGTEHWENIYQIVPTNGKFLTVQSWLALWHMMSLQDYFNCLKFLVIIGCELPFNDIYLLTDEREIMEINYRRVFAGFVLAHDDVDKAWILSSFLGNNENSLQGSAKKWACRVIEESSVMWECKYLVLVDFPKNESQEITKLLSICDVGIIVDAEDQLGRSEDFALPSTLPKLRINSAGFLQPHKIQEIFATAFRFACRPFEGLDNEIKEKLLRNRKKRRNSILQVLGILGTGLGLVGYFLYKKKLLNFSI